jgi:hypothetical protein
MKTYDKDTYFLLNHTNDIIYGGGNKLQNKINKYIYKIKKME